MRRCVATWFVHQAVVGLAAVVFFAAGAQSAEDRIELLDGKIVPGEITAIDATGKITVSGEGAMPLALDSLRQVVRSGSVDSSRRAAVVVYLAGGNVVQADKIATQGDNCVVSWSFGEELTIPIDMIRGIRLTPSGDDKARLKGTEEFEKAVAAESATRDQLLVIVDEAVQSIAGVFEEITAESVAFNYEDKRKVVSRGKVYGVLIAPVGKPADRTGHVQAALTDGSLVTGRLLKLAEGKLTLELAKGSQTTVPWENVVRLGVKNDRLAFLSDRQPLDVSEATLLTLARPWQRDKSVQGRPITLGTKIFAKGLGVHAKSVLSFDAEGYDLFAATIGIDAATRGRGDCEFAVAADGKEIFRKRMRGSDEPVELRLPVTGAKRLTLTVEPGEDLDLADHADWADARLIRELKDAKPEKK